MVSKPFGKGTSFANNNPVGDAGQPQGKMPFGKKSKGNDEKKQGAISRRIAGMKEKKDDEKKGKK